MAKGQEFLTLTKTLSLHGQAVILIRQDAKLLQKAFDQTNIPIITALNMTKAVKITYKLAKPDNTVILSPAYASFNIYHNYKQRGKVFVNTMQELALSVKKIA